MIYMPNAAKEIDPRELFEVINGDMYTVDVDISEQQALNFSLCEILESADYFSFEIDTKLRELIHNAIALLNILARLDDYNSGSIKYDGVELKDIEKHYLRQNIGIVNQDSYVFTTTVKNNLTILNKNEDNLQQNVNKVCLQEDIEKFPQGMLTMVGEKGVTLSGGQRQRISIARTLMKNKNILFLDDSLSAVDNNVSKTIRSALKDDKITTLIISHNFINIMDADQIIVLDKGKKDGNYD